jgi:hypothetical protein
MKQRCRHLYKPVDPDNPKRRKCRYCGEIIILVGRGEIIILVGRGKQTVRKGGDEDGVPK